MCNCVSKDIKTNRKVTEMKKELRNREIRKKRAGNWMKQTGQLQT